MAQNVSSSEPTDIAAGLEALVGREHVSEDYIRFRIELLKSQTAVRDALVRSACSSSSAAGDAKKGGKPSALHPSEVPLDGALLRKSLEDLSAALGRHQRRSEEVSRLWTAAGKDPELLEQLAVKAAFGPDEVFLASLSERLEISVEALLFFGRVLGAPFVAEAAGRLKQDARATPEAAGCCPWCGSPPGLAMLKREDGRRVLFCSLCGESWEFARLECPFCNSPAGLGMLTVETADPYSIETCEQCNGYLKTVDERKLPEDKVVVPLVETTATLYLDLIAEKEGYARALPYAALR
jgi:FdhE protein